MYKEFGPDDEIIQNYATIYRKNDEPATVLPKNGDLPDFVRERCDWIMKAVTDSDASMSFIGMLRCIFAQNNEQEMKDDFEMAGLDWLPVSIRFREWSSMLFMDTLHEMRVAAYLIYGEAAKAQRERNERVSEYASRLRAVSSKLPAEMLLDLKSRLGDWSLSGGYMGSEYVLQLVVNAERYAAQHG